MEPNESHKNTRDIILERINARTVSVRPRFYFVARILFAILMALLVLGFSALLFNFVLFYLVTRSHLPLLSFGPSGWLVFLYVFPWGIAVLDALCVFILWRLIRNFKFIYKNPALYPVLLIIVLVALLGSLVEERSEVNQFARERAHQGQLPPPVGKFFNPRHERQGSPGDAYRGIVEEVGPDSFTLLSTDLGTTTYTVVVGNDELRDLLKQGDAVIVGGKLVDDTTIEAFGVRLIPPRND